MIVHLRRGFSTSSRPSLEAGMKNVVLTLGFNGLDFKGSHYLDETEGRTVEREIEKALVEAGIIERSKSFHACKTE